MKISAAMVKELRERTGSGMMECKKALVQSNGDLEAAINEMRKSGLAKADKKSGRIAAEGCITIKISNDGKKAAMVEINSETDFVAKADDFKGFADMVVDQVLNSEVSDVDGLLAASAANSGESIEETRRHLVAKLGENINIRRFNRYSTNSGLISNYLHGTRIGVLVELEGGDDQLGKDVAMHIAASRPICVDEKNVPAETMSKERDVLIGQAEQSGKPKEIIEKMIQGRLKKFLGEITLVGQPFVKDSDKDVGQLLKENDATAIRFIRFEVGEGIEKKQENFAEEVMAQARGG